MRVRPFAETVGYTTIHNSVLDVLMPSMPPNAFKVLMFVLRKTHGWDKDEDALSYSQIVTGTGIKSPATVSAALQYLKQHGCLLTVAGDKWDAMTYQLNTALEVEWCPTSKNEVDKTTSRTEATSNNEAVPTTEIVVVPTTEIEDTGRQENPRKKSIAADAHSAPPQAPQKTPRTRKPKAEPDSPSAVRQALADVCAIDYGKHGPKEPKLQVNTVAGKLWRAAQDAGATEAQAIDGIKTTAAYCRRTVYPYKDGQPLTPAAIHKHWRAAIQERDKNRAARTNGHHVNGAASTPSALASLAPADVADPNEIVRLFRQRGAK